MVLHGAIQAARAGDLATLRQLASSSHLQPGITDAQGAGLVHHAARCGRLECLQFLVGEQGLPPDARALNGATALHDAAATGHIRELEWLVQAAGCNLEVSSSIPTPSQPPLVILLIPEQSYITARVIKNKAAVHHHRFIGISR